MKQIRGPIAAATGPRRHIVSLYDLPPATQADLWALVAATRAELSEEDGPDGFNIGVNDG